MLYGTFGVLYYIGNRQVFFVNKLETNLVFPSRVNLWILFLSLYRFNLILFRDMVNFPKSIYYIKVDLNKGKIDKLFDLFYVKQPYR